MRLRAEAPAPAHDQRCGRDRSRVDGTRKPLGRRSRTAPGTPARRLRRPTCPRKQVAVVANHAIRRIVERGPFAARAPGVVPCPALSTIHGPRRHHSSSTEVSCDKPLEFPVNADSRESRRTARRGHRSTCSSLIPVRNEKEAGNQRHSGGRAGTLGRWRSGPVSINLIQLDGLARGSTAIAAFSAS